MSAPTAPSDITGPDSFRRERAALERLLASGLFDRSPSLALFLRYVCGKYFEGRTDDIKEYNIAVEALGRPADFDQKRDAIVRVEAHRLRKRLQQYFEGKGHEEPIHIVIPPGTYAPQFLFKTAVTSDTAPQILDEAPVIAPPAVPQPSPKSRLPLFLALSLGVLALVAGALYWNSTKTAQAAKSSVVSDAPAVPGGVDEVRLLAGSTASRYVDHLGNSWFGDRFFKGGIAANVPARPILRTLDSAMFLSRREGDFKYDIPLRPGVYELRLYFAETIFGENNIAGGGESSRIFSVRMNGQNILNATDVLADAGGSNIAHVRVYRDVRPASDGLLHLEFLPNYKEVAFVNAIEVVPGTHGRLNPIRIIARPSSFTDSKGAEWSPDQFFFGGQYVQRHDKVAGTADQELFQSERFGNFSYAVPVVENSRYTATLSFCEHWFGAGRPGGGGSGRRVFDVYINGRTLLENFDVFKEAGGALRPIQKTFRNLQPNAQGKLVFQFVPVRNYALVNAIEITEDSK